MSPTNNDSNEVTQAKPVQVGTTRSEVADLIEEIGHSGVADSPAQVEAEGVLERDHDNRSSDAPTPIVTSD